MESFVSNYLEIMLDREKGEIKIGNSVLKSNISIFNYPRGFGRKTIISNLLHQDLSDWNSSKNIEFRFIENYYMNSHIVKEKSFHCLKTNYTIILCDRKNMENWKNVLKKQNMKFIHYDRKKRFSVKDNDNSIILIHPEIFCYFIQTYFHRVAMKRFILFDPELMTKHYSFPKFFYGFAWIISAEPIYLLSFEQKHFIYNFIPYQMNPRDFNILPICKDLKIQTNLKFVHKLPNYHLVKHSCRDEMYKLLKGILDEDLYDLIHNGQIKEMLERLNSISTSNNIIDYIQEKIENETTEITNKLENYKNLKIKKGKDLDELNKKLNELTCKKKNLIEKVKEYTNQNDCIICEDHMKEPIILYCCQNILCWKCIVHWLNENNNCPYCRKIIYNDDIISLKYKIDPSEGRSSPNFVKLMTRQNKVFDLIETNRKNGEIMFFYSDVNEIISNVISFCIQHNISYIEFRDFDKKCEVYEKIRNHDIQLILLSDFHDLIGYEFPMVNHFISFPYLKKYVYKFICSRFYRLGREKDFHFHSFVSFS